MRKAVILFSGGLDSTTCLAFAKAQQYRCYTLSFNYGQKASVEIEIGKKLAQQFEVAHHKIFDLNLNQFGGSALTDQKIDVPTHVDNNEIPVTYVPARNTIFLSVALGYAEVLDAHDIFIGVSAIDYSGYPDCRPKYIAAFQEMADLATKAGIEGHGIKIHTPLIHLSKAQTIALGTHLGVDYSQTLTCYQGDNEARACGTCSSCTLRKRGFEEAHLPDPTRYR
jgi:7-cyano-7-deazaguanine synthase